jgi:hypothetical protein
MNQILDLAPPTKKKKKKIAGIYFFCRFGSQFFNFQRLALFQMDSSSGTYLVVKVRLPDKPDFVDIPSSNIINMTTSELLSHFSQCYHLVESVTLALEDNHCISYVPPDDVRICCCVDDLIVNPGRPQSRFFLSVLKGTHCPHLRYSIPVVDFSGRLLYHCAGKFQLSSRLIPEELFRPLAAVHKVSMDSFKFYDCTGTIADLNIESELFLKNLIYGRYFILFDLDRNNADDNCLRSIQRRAGAVQEFFTNEAYYCGFLENFPREIDALTTSLAVDLNPKLIKVSQSIYKAHLQLAEILRSIHPDFFGGLGTALSQWDFSQLSAYGAYQEIYDGLQPVLSVPENKGLDEICMQIVQRPVHMRSVLESLLKSTPPEHPDREALDFVYQRIDAVVHDVNETAGIPKGKSTLQNILDQIGRLPQEWTGRSLFYLRHFDGPENMLIFFAGHLGILPKPPRKKLRFESLYAFHDLMWSLGKKTGLVIESPAQRIRIELRNDCDDAFLTCRAAALSAKCDVDGQLKIQSRREPGLFLPRLDHALFWARNQIWVFGGHQPGRRPTAEVEIIGKWKGDLRGAVKNGFSLPPDDLIPRDGFGFTQQKEEAFYIYGGVDDSLNKYRDLWRFEFETRKWTQIIYSRGIPPSGSPGAMTNFGDWLIVVIEDKLFRFELLSRQWQCDCRPIPTKIFALFPIDENITFAFRRSDQITLSTTKQEIVEVWKIDGQNPITQMQVTGCPPLFQPKLRYVRRGGSIIVFWGTLKTTVVELDLQKARWMPVRLKEFPRVLGNYSLCTNGERIWIYGRQPPYEGIEGKLFRIEFISPTERPNRPRS